MIARSRHPLTTSVSYTVRTNLKDFVKSEGRAERRILLSRSTARGRMKTSRASWQLKVCHFSLLRPSFSFLPSFLPFFLSFSLRSAAGGAPLCLRRFGVRGNETEGSEERGGGAKRGDDWRKSKGGEGTRPTEIIGCACALINLYTFAGAATSHHHHLFLSSFLYIRTLGVCTNTRVCFAMIGAHARPAILFVGRGRREREFRVGTLSRRTTFEPGIYDAKFRDFARISSSIRA